MCESSRLPGSPIDSHPDINDVLNIAEEIVEIPVGHVEGHVANEKRLRGRMRLARVMRPRPISWCSGFLNRVLDGHTTAFVILHVEHGDRFIGLFQG